MFHALVESHHVEQRRGALDGFRALQRSFSVQDQALQATLGNVLDDRQGSGGLLPVFHNDILQLGPQEILDDGLVRRIDFNEVRKNTQRLPVSPAHIVEELLNGLGAVGTPDSKITDGLQAVLNSVSSALRFRNSLHAVGVTHAEADTLRLCRRKFGAEPGHVRLIARMFIARRVQLQLNARGTFQDLRNFPFQTIDLRHQTLDHFVAACDLVTNTSFIAYDFELLPAKVSYRTLLCRPLFIQACKRYFQNLVGFDHAQAILFGLRHLSRLRRLPPDRASSFSIERSSGSGSRS